MDFYMYLPLFWKRAYKPQSFLNFRAPAVPEYNEDPFPAPNDVSQNYSYYRGINTLFRPALSRFLPEDNKIALEKGRER
jgi:hypothetical protein